MVVITFGDGEIVKLFELGVVDGKVAAKGLTNNFSFSGLSFSCFVKLEMPIGFYGI